ncbi:MAG: hypothetical protein ACRC8C_01680 [Mycoplasmoidaceae bacterium]
MNKKIKLSLLGALITSSAIAFTLPIISCSNTSTSENILTIDPKSLGTATGFCDGFLSNEMKLKNRQGQTELAATWTVGKPIFSPFTELEKLTINNLVFIDGSNQTLLGFDVVETITFKTETTIPVAGEIIKGPVLNITLKKGYSSANPLTITISDLGPAKA